MDDCPNCSYPTFNGWECKKCGYEIPQKARKAYGKLLTEEEAKEARKKLDIPEKGNEMETD
jgi:DNA-directed RNA polymerase subunit M/transcription elongation factor TFIIS